MNYEHMVAKVHELVTLYGLKIIAALAILFFGWIASKLIRSIIRKLLTKMNVDTMLISFFQA